MRCPLLPRSIRAAGGGGIPQATASESEFPIRLLTGTKNTANQTNNKLVRTMRVEHQSDKKRQPTLMRSVLTANLDNLAKDPRLDRQVVRDIPVDERLLTQTQECPCRMHQRGWYVVPR